MQARFMPTAANVARTLLFQRDIFYAAQAVGLCPVPRAAYAYQKCCDSAESPCRASIIGSVLPAGRDRHLRRG